MGDPRCEHGDVQAPPARGDLSQGFVPLDLGSDVQEKGDGFTSCGPDHLGGDGGAGQVPVGQGHPGTRSREAEGGGAADPGGGTGDEGDGGSEAQEGSGGEGQPTAWVALDGRG